MAVTPHHLSTLAALELMTSGGNAVDGAIAANAVQGVVAPETCGIGGDLFALVHAPGMDEPACLNASGRAGSGAHAETLRDRGETEMPLYGPASVTVPGCVDGWMALHDRFGRLPLDRVLAPALRHCRDGFAASTELHTAWTNRAEELMTQASANSLYPDGRPPERGEQLQRPMLAASLEAVLAGRDTFYVDRLGPGIVEATDGWITAEDLSRNQAEWVDPVGTTLFGRTAWTTPPNTQGYLTPATLGVFAALDPPTDPHDPDYTHLLIEAYRCLAWERDDLATDPETAPRTGAELVDPGVLASKAAQLDRDRAGSWATPRRVPAGTAFLCTVDADGLGISLIQSNYHGIGAGLSAGDTGVWLHNRGGGFNLVPGHANELGPGKRPLHTLSPTLWTANGRLDLLLGTRGGHHQPQLLAQLAAHRLHAGLDLADAQAFPRWTIPGFADPVSHIVVETRMTPHIRESLAARGHEIEERADWVPGWGPIAAIEIDAAGLRTGAADPRVDTALAAAG